ncbi:MAG: hypothetical protein NTY20_05270 [Candidatus Aenigmarchaeota archaeon]|nr:hypothetical protein [Candidatus Aenigmarchaeota archaeon]
MAAGRFMKVIGMYAIGLVLIFVGLYMIAFMSYGPTGFGLMVAGLLFSTIGGFYGKKKLLEGTPEKLPPIESRQIDQLKQNVVSQLRPPETLADPPKIPVEQPKPEPKPAIPIQPKAQEPVLPSEPSEARGVVKILICPGCNTENPPANMFCSNCGKRLKAIPKPATQSKPKSRKKKRAKPAKHASG